MGESISILGGTGSSDLAAAVVRDLGAHSCACRIERFPDGEISVSLLESVRNKDIFIVQSTSPPVDEHLVELLALTDACRRSGAGRIAAVIPYFGYARADKRRGRREPITARLVADLLETVGIVHVVTVDLHTPQIEGFFRVPVDSLTATKTLCRALRPDLPRDAVVVSPDAGRVTLATAYAQLLGLPLVLLHKRRTSGSETSVTHVVGEVAGHACLIIDDMISTGGTIAESIKALLGAGARAEIVVAATHGLLLPAARERLRQPAVRSVYVTDTIQIDARGWPQLHVVSVAPLFAEALRRVIADGSLAELV